MGAERDTESSFLGDLLALTKPTITVTNVLMAAGGLWLSRTELSLATVVWTLIGTALAVAAANALNMLLEREGDGLMERTRGRPLPAGRLGAGVALGVGLGLSAGSIAALVLGTNLLTAGLGALALALYVLAYTPLKRRTPWALIVGAIPGAMPALMGWTAARGRIEAPGLVLLGVLFLWQLPHFIAIALLRREDYARAGIKTVPLVWGDRVARWHAAISAAALLSASLLLVPLGTAGRVYLVGASLLGAWLTVLAVQGLRATEGRPWDRRLFFASLAYLPGWMLVTLVDRLVG
ncbi:MAG: protoheme IX farnesyltransferase [Deltaproteobacteria bacterium]|nr:protoheme IX farnesyltransferase [Deltaproteobacteria bacterium]